MRRIQIGNVGSHKQTVDRLVAAPPSSAEAATGIGTYARVAKYILAALAATLLFVSCDNLIDSLETEETYSLSYNANGATSGEAPTDTTAYESGSTATISDNTGELAKDEHRFVGWNTAADGTGEGYEAGNTLSFGDASVILYATWAPDIAKILAADGDKGDNFGSSVAISDDYAIVGVPGDDDNGDSGSAYIFQRTGPNGWDTGTKIVPSDGASNDIFGSSVAITGDYAIVGAPNDEDNGGKSGSAYIFRRTGPNSWDTVTKIVPSDGRAAAYFGFSVAINGDYAVVGARADTNNGIRTGSAYIFQRTGPNGWDTETKIVPPDVDEWYNFGFSVAISGDHAIIGAPDDDDFGFSSGSAYIFQRTGPNSWDTGTKIVASDGRAATDFGRSVAISGDYAIIGVYRDDNNGMLSGSAYIFQRTGPNSWDTGTKIVPSDGDVSDYFGRSVAISGDYAVVGAENSDGNVLYSGSAYIFQRTGTNNWNTGTKIVASDGEGGDVFGRSVAISGDYAIVSAPGDASSGSAYIKWIAP